eukprot:11481-Heterococcus_DN1.PRE.1
MIESLIANGADVDAYNSNDESPLLLALYAHNEQNAAVLIRAGTDVTHVDSTGLSTLFAAAQWSLTDTVQLLLEHGAAAVIEAECPPLCCGAITALMVAQDPRVVKLLLAAGADVHKRTRWGNTGLHVAAAHKHPASVVCQLIKAGVDLHARNSAGQIAAMVARGAGADLLAAVLVKAAEEQRISAATRVIE